tara:strand:+ start:4193 stop:5536 length:1344 start_codon:yes stop_codon:yes gene_type:complete
MSQESSTDIKEYVKNVSGNVTISGSFSENSKAKSGMIFLYEKQGQEDFILDSVKVKNGVFIFPKRTFQTGVYKMSFNNATNALDFVINPNATKDLKFEFSNYRIKKGYKTPNSIENQIKKKYDSKEESINGKIKLIRKSNKSREEKIAEMTILQNELFALGSKLSLENPGTYFGMIMSRMNSEYVDVNHLYFNDIDFTDECIVRSDLLPTRIQVYFQKHSNYPNNKYGFHDAVDLIMEYAKVNEKVAEFCMYNMLDGFYNTGQTDKKNQPIWQDLCNYIMDNYIFGEGCGDDIEPSQLLKDRASQYKNLQIGHIPADFTAIDMNNKNVNLKNICIKNKYTVLMFWASHCQHCMTELPPFANWYNQNTNKDFEIVAVSLDANKDKWTNTVKSNNFNWINICQFKIYKSPICLDYKIKKTPTMFILNSDMEIVSKPKSTHQLRSFLQSN